MFAGPVINRFIGDTNLVCVEGPTKENPWLTRGIPFLTRIVF
jgi:hypothetical protein